MIIRNCHCRESMSYHFDYSPALSLLSSTEKLNELQFNSEHYQDSTYQNEGDHEEKHNTDNDANGSDVYETDPNTSQTVSTYSCFVPCHNLLSNVEHSRGCWHGQ
jgi:hypothetical protein